MLLALDAGNSNITVGVFDAQQLIMQWRLRTIHEQTADEWGILFRNLFALAGLQLDRIQGMAIASVVPPLEEPLRKMAQRYFSLEPLFLTHGIDLGISLRIDNPREAGADRLANAVAGFHLYGGPCVVVDLGTAINFDVVSAKGEFLGGIICPGIGMAAQGLFSKTARLPLVDFREPAQLIGANTVDCIQSGLYYSTVGAIDGIFERLVAELGPGTHCVATGGQAALVAKGSRFIKTVDEALTLEGLRLVWERNPRAVQAGG
ncbi:MAG: type III pantothenate kinase [Acidobacteria bacterium]|nr:type III pantothenate kinase [Acidobacteriota bacterium]